jgi:hypothetical protein
LLKDPFTQRALEDANPWKEASVAVWASSVILMVLVVVGTRVVFAIPVDLRANWVFRITGPRSAPETVRAARRPLLLLAVVPVWLGSAAVSIVLWPSWQSVGHVITLGVVGLILAELCLIRFYRIPFACSYLPGKSRVHIVFMGAFGLLVGSISGVLFERQAFRERGTAVAWFVVSALLLLGARVAAWRLAAGNAETEFEGHEPEAIQGLGLV